MRYYTRSKTHWSKTILRIIGIILLVCGAMLGIYEIFDYMYWVNFTEEGRDFRADIDPEWGQVRAQEQLSEALRQQQSR